MNRVLQNPKSNTLPTGAAESVDESRIPPNPQIRPRPQIAHALRRRRSRPAPINRPTRALVGSGTAFQVRVLLLMLNEP